MTGNAPLNEVVLRGNDYLDPVTDLLIRARSDDPMAGPWEAGDLQWWYAIDSSGASREDTFWLDADGAPVASMLMFTHRSELYFDMLWRPSLDARIRKEVLPLAFARLTELDEDPAHCVNLTVDERDGDLRHRLESAGFRHDPAGDYVQMWQRPLTAPAPLSLPDGMVIDDDRSRPATQRHHLAKRNGEGIAERLRACSLYRQDLDLRIRTETGDVAAYCLCWLDSTNGVGLLEPVRTEDAYQRRGLGRALLTEAIRRFMANGVTLIKVTREADSEAARRLYAGVGFQDAHRKLKYVGRTAGTPS